MVPVVASLAAIPAHAEWRMEVLDGEWYLAGFENSYDLSGIAAANDTQCLVGSDESFYVQPGVIEAGKRRIESRRPLALPLQSPGGAREIDVEGVAFSATDQAYYVVGSHGVGTKKGDFQPDRHAVYRILVDPVSGVVKKEGILRSSLLPWLEKTPLVAPHVGVPLQKNGLNIEGLTCTDGVLYFGLRSPNLDGQGLILEIRADDLFGKPPGKLKVHKIALPAGSGIREIAAVRDGFLLVVGNASAPASKKIAVSLAKDPDVRFELMFWGGEETSPARIGELPRNGGKAEGLLVRDDAEHHIDLLVVFDGIPGGEPLSLRVHR